ncbi:stage II sporulation protein R [Thermoactinomyces daqus]|nr:stage II sporulation protein R [Thermoactinomyces daqus]
MRKWTHIFMLFSAVFAWVFAYVAEGSGPEAGAVSPSAPEIPKQAIRLRILANSDSVGDQWLKRRVRDAIVREIGTWALKPKNIEEARRAIRERLPLLRRIAEQTVHHYGYSYPVKVDFGQVPFPTKLYGNKIYPAGNYEALRITIGKGLGSNWWCVLFPPLCFIDMSNGDAIDGKETTQTLSASAAQDVYVEMNGQAREKSSAEGKLQVRFLLLDQLAKWWHW